MDELKEMRDLRFKCLQMANCFENSCEHELMNRAEELFLFCVKFQIQELELEVNSDHESN